MSPHSDTLSCFRANQSLLFLLNAECEEATHTNFVAFDLTRLVLEASTLTVTQYIYIKGIISSQTDIVQNVFKDVLYRDPRLYRYFF